MGRELLQGIRSERLKSQFHQAELGVGRWSFLGAAPAALLPCAARDREVGPGAEIESASRCKPADTCLGSPWPTVSHQALPLLVDLVLKVALALLALALLVFLGPVRPGWTLPEPLAV